MGFTPSRLKFKLTFSLFNVNKLRSSCYPTTTNRFCLSVSVLADSTYSKVVKIVTLIIKMQLTIGNQIFTAN